MTATMAWSLFCLEPPDAGKTPEMGFVLHGHQRGHVQSAPEMRVTGFADDGFFGDGGAGGIVAGVQSGKGDPLANPAVRSKRRSSAADLARWSRRCQERKAVIGFASQLRIAQQPVPEPPASGVSERVPGFDAAWPGHSEPQRVRRGTGKPAWSLFFSGVIMRVRAWRRCAMAIRCSAWGEGGCQGSNGMRAAYSRSTLASSRSVLLRCIMARAKIPSRARVDDHESDPRHAQRQRQVQP